MNFYNFAYAPDLFEAIDPDANYFSHFQNSIQSNYVSVDEFIEIFNENSIMFNLLTYNVRSFHTNSQFMLPIIKRSNLQAVVLSETWFTDDYQASV